MESETPTSEMTPSDLPHDPSADMRDFQGSKSAELCCTTIQEVSVADICTESILQVRVKTADMRVKSYAALMSNGTEFPPIVIFNDGQSLWLADGKHRIDAAKRNGYSTIRADVRHGTERDAFLYGLQVNAAHGLALTQAEKRAAVDLMLQDAEWGTWSDREIARQCGATHPSVSRRRQAATGKFYQLPQTRKYKRGDKTIEMDTTRIGKGSSPTDQSEVMIDASSTGESDQTAEPGAPDEMEESLQPGNLASSASRLQSQGHCDQGIGAALRDDEGPFSKRQEVATHNKSGGSEPEESDCGGRPEPNDTPSAELQEIQASQAPLLALQSFYDGAEGDVHNFRAQYACNDCDDSRVKRSLECYEEGLQHAQRILVADTQQAELVGIDLDVEDTATPEHDEARAHDDPDAQSNPPSSEETLTTAERSSPFDVVQAFVKRRCIPASGPVSHHDVMASIDTWLDDQNLPLLNENEVIRELCRMGFDGANVTVHDGKKTNAGWQWNGFQLLPSDAPDNKVDPFGLRHT